MPDPLELLARDDKWSLGAGDGVLHAPRFPLWLDTPGFWDEATLHQYTVAPLFTVTLLDEAGSELALRAVSRRWTPAALTLEYRLANGVSAIEVRTVQPGGVFASEWRVRALRSGRFHLVAWTLQPTAAAQAAAWRGAFAFRRTLLDRWQVPLEVELELGCASGTTSWGAAVAECATTQPRWRATPFRAMWASERLPDAVQPQAAPAPGAEFALYAAVHRVLDVNGDRASATFAMRVVPVDPRLRTRPIEARLPTVRATSPVAAPARTGVHVPAAPPATLDRLSRQRWTDLVERAPRFSCSDPYLESYVRHRWAGLWLMLTGAGGDYPSPLVCEAGADRHLPTAATMPSLVRELRWLRDPSLARGAMRAFLGRQRHDGAVPACIALQHVPEEAAPSASWGDALLALDAAAPDAELRVALLPRLAKWTEWAAPRVAAAMAGDDGVRGASGDASVMVADLLGAYDALAALDGTHDGGAFAARAAALRHEAQRRLWNAATRTFGGGGRPDAAGLLLYGAGVATDEQLAALGPALADPARLGTPYPFPSPVAPGVARVDPAIAVRAADAVARAAGDDHALRRASARLIGRLVHTFFADGDLERPGAFEHYDAHRGHASEYRGYDDVQRAAVGDLVLSWIAGIRPHARGVTVDPLPADLERVEVTGVRLRGRELCVFVDGDRVLATWDGQPHEAALGEAIELRD